MVICVLGVESNSKIDPEGQGKGSVSRGTGRPAPIAIFYGALASGWVFLPGAGNHVTATDTSLKRSYKISLYCESKWRYLEIHSWKDDCLYYQGTFSNYFLQSIGFKSIPVISLHSPIYPHTFLSRRESRKTGDFTEYSHGGVPGTRKSALFGVVVSNNKSLLWPVIFFLLGILSFERKIKVYEISSITHIKLLSCGFQPSSSFFITLIFPPITTLSREQIKAFWVNSWEKKQLECNKNHGDLVGKRVMSVKACERTLEAGGS